MNSNLEKINETKSFFIKKDLLELQHWLTKLEENHQELDYVQVIHQQIIQDTETAYSLQQERRKNTLALASLCKYEQQLKKVLEYSYEVYDLDLAHQHEKKRVEFINTDKSFFAFKISFYKKLSKYNIR
ncbi:hypothetical protein [Mesonia maritima]|uniref:PH domain-containing protein n=1 Tax=Mesonia maritima TaxID=1793873 RepID=A0ABU1K5T3_9FLAO|nr:hypothetical protein [Mesonia maritima]MDR6300980.1 hypothetical protein [Mesonia maritima]